MYIIEAKKLTKQYRRYKKQEGLRGSIKGLFHREYEERTAVNQFDLLVEEGEFIGLIGPNGAGKTTLVKMLTGIIAPTGGALQVMGFYPNKLEYALKRQYAVVMGQKSQLFFELTTEDTLRLFKELYGITEENYRRNRKYLAELFQVEEFMNVPVRTLSLGERMKMELIAALIHDPRILFLDEPTIGLDAVASRQIRGFLREVNEKRGTTILLTSHYMEDIKVLCRRSVVINHGRKLFDGETDRLFEQYQTSRRMTLFFSADTRPEIPEGCQVLEQTEEKLQMTVPKEQAESILETFISRYSIKDVSIEEEDIGSVVERIYQGGEKA